MNCKKNVMEVIFVVCAFVLIIEWLRNCIDSLSKKDKIHFKGTYIEALEAPMPGVP